VSAATVDLASSGDCPEKHAAIGDPHVLQIAKPGIEVAHGIAGCRAVLQPAISE
jgi:hypothetical protein